MKRLLIYHRGCADGFAAAWLFHLAFPDAEFHAARYGEPPPDVAGKEVYVADFSYKRPVMLGVVSKAASVTVLDHHKTAAADLDGFADECQRGCGLPRPTVVFDMAKSGGRLAWEYLYGGCLLPDEWLSTSRSGYSLGVAPWPVDYTEDRDLWRWALPKSREVSAALRSYPFDFGVWDELHARGRAAAGLAAEGSAILRAESAEVARHVRNAAEVDIGGHRVLCVNATTHQSEVAGELAAGRPFGACYFDRADGRRVYSLRSRDGGVDVSEVAKAFGGGGHARAAGYELPAPRA